MEYNFSKAHKGCYTAVDCSVKTGLALEGQVHLVFRGMCPHLMHGYKAADHKLYYCTRNYMITCNSSKYSQ